MAIALVQQNVFEANSYATTIACTFASDVTAGNLIDVSVRWNNEGTHEGVSGAADGLGNTYTNIAGCNVGTDASARSMVVLYAKNITGGACTVTVTFLGTRTSRLVTISEWSGLETTAPADQATGQVQSAVTAVSTTAVTPTADGELCLGTLYGIYAGAATITEDGTLVVEDETDIFHSTQYSVQATAASIARTWTLGAGRDVMSAIRTYKAAGGGGGDPAVEHLTIWEGKQEWRAGQAGPPARAISIQRGEFG